jgi:hypothetical protein
MVGGVTSRRKGSSNILTIRESRAEHRGDRQDDVPINHALVEDPAHLADPVVHVDFRTTQAQRRLTAHRHQVLALATVQAAVCDIAHLFRVATRKHLGHQVIVVGCLITRMGALEWVPVIGKDPLEDTPVSRELCHHRVAPSWGDDLFAVKRLSHGFPASSTPHLPVPGYPSPASCILEYGDFRDWENAFSYTIKINQCPPALIEYFLFNKVCSAGCDYI